MTNQDRGARQDLTSLWRAMQYIERNRHVAETLEAQAPDCDPVDACLLIGAAARRRQLADQMYALWSNGALEPATWAALVKSPSKLP